MAQQAKRLVPSKGPESWRPLLAKPDLHWRRGYSARTLTHAWEAPEDGDVPPEVAPLFDEHEDFTGWEPLLIVPEWKTGLPPSNRGPSQSDVFVLARTEQGLVTITVEGKVNESFGPTVEEWLKESPEGSGKQERLEFLKNKLNLDRIGGELRYQLLHRAAAAVIEAERFHANSAAMVVHSFSATQEGFGDYETI